MLILSENIGRRVLSPIKPPWNTSTEVMELKILELSPSAQWIKLMNSNGKKFWRRVEGFEIIEVLEVKPVGEPKPAG